MVHGVNGEHMGHVVSHVEEVSESVKDNARTQHLHMEEETALDQIQSQPLVISICAQVGILVYYLVELRTCNKS